LKKQRSGIIVQARMGSTRLPAKVMKEILGEPMLWRVIERLKAVASADVIVIATPQDPQSDPLVKLAQKAKVEVFRGSEEDVLERYYQAAEKNKLDVVVRVTSDCPLIDPQVVDACLRYFLGHPPVDYVSNTMQRTFPRGMDTEVFSFKALEKAYQKALEPYEREHVTPYIAKHGKTLSYQQKENQSVYRLTVDTAEDFELIKKIFETLYPKDKNFTLADIIKFLKQNPSLVNINKHVQQKALPQG